MPQLYTPFMEKAVKSIGDARYQRDQNKAYSSAYMGEPGAMERLIQFSPEMAYKLQQQKQVAEQQKLVNQSNKIKKLKVIAKEKREYFEETKELGSKIKTYPEFQSFLEQRREMLRQEIGDDVDLLPPATPEMFEQVKQIYGDVGGGSNIGQVSPKDFTVESIGKYEQSGNIQDLDRYSPKTVKVAGVEHQLNPVTQKWEPIIDAASKDLSVQAKAIADLEADKKSRLDFAKSKTKWMTESPKFKSKIASAKASQTILEATAEQVKERVNGWTTKYGAVLSSLPGSEARILKNLINTLTAHSAFSTLTALKASGGTLGAISEAELILLKAKLGAVDQGGDATELMRVVDQIVNFNTSSISRLETEFTNTNAMYSGGFDDLGSAQTSQDVDAMSDEDLFN